MKLSSLYYLPLLATCFHLITAHCSINNNSMNLTANKSNLVMVQAIFRHGDRNPVKSFKGDLWAASKYWPEGLGKLTNIGKQQQYQLGQWFRSRYEKLLFANGFSADKVQIISSNVERAMMSAAAFSAGLFPPTKDQIWNKDLFWQPVPIYTIARDVDTMLLPKRPCPLYCKLYTDFQKSKTVKKKIKKFQKTFDVLKKNCGADVANMYGAAIIYDTLYIEVLKNRTIPFWAKKIYGNLEKIAQFQKFSYGAKPQLARLHGGFLIKECIDKFSKKIDVSTFESRNVVVYSAHDATIAAALTALNLYDMELPPYASCVLFELHELDGEYFIQIFYRKTPTENIFPLYIPKCGCKCPLKKFIKLYEAIIPTKSFDDECKIQG